MTERRESREVIIGIIAVGVAAYFMLVGMEVIDIPYRIVEPDFGTLLAFVLVAIGVYLVTKNTNK
jgi:hypothetical protein